MPTRDASKLVKMWCFDGRVGIPLLLFLIHPRDYVLYILLAMVTLLVFLDRRGVPLDMIGRKARSLVVSLFVGGRRKIRPIYRGRLQP